MSLYPKITKARRKHLAAHPFDPAKNAIPCYDGAGMPSGFMTMPDMGEMQILAMRLGMEYLAIAHDEDAVEDWIHTTMGLAGSPDLNGIMLVNVLRGIAPIIAARQATDRDTAARALYESLAVEAWEKDFTDLPDAA
ncbi:hypothetical protein [Corynebacterium mastitidis]|uniref:Uncharacterized protein n=1 Tax=Corynebacterium mastitidis TaxID=161890 RepID=A0A2N0X9F6_9CORY|nr:hypothetical protein [Corynebacterium mastitidis]PKF69340.1 hypothetical protein CXB45_02360 [Corynebacterium mastitidis]